MAKKKQRSGQKNNVKEWGSDFRKEFKKQIITGITAAFGFLIALTWREPISELINDLVGNLNLQYQILAKFLTAILVTIIAAVVLLYMARWAADAEEKKKKS